MWRRVLDFGCGSGGSAIALALAYSSVTCVGIDINPREVTIAGNAHVSMMSPLAARSTASRPGSRCPIRMARSISLPVFLGAGICRGYEAQGILHSRDDPVAGSGRPAVLFRAQPAIPARHPYATMGVEAISPSSCARKPWTAPGMGGEAAGAPGNPEVVSDPLARTSGPGRIFVYGAKPAKLPPIAPAVELRRSMHLGEEMCFRAAKCLIWTSMELRRTRCLLAPGIWAEWCLTIAKFRTSLQTK